MEIGGRRLPKIELVKFTKEKEEQYRNVMPYLIEELDKYEESTGKEETLRYLLMSVDGEERLVQFINNCCVIFYFKNDVLITRYMELDENYRVKHASYEGYEIVESDDNLLIVDAETGVIQDFDYSLNDGKDADGYNATGLYTQYNQDTDSKLHLVYRLIDRKDGKMYSFHLNDPYKIIFMDDASTLDETDKINFKTMRAYAKYEFDYELHNPYYNLVTVREHGLLKTMNEGAGNIQQVNPLTRYFRINGADGKGNLKINFAFGEFLSPEQLKEEMDKHQFRMEVPEYMIEIYNGEDVSYFVDCCVAQTISMVDKDYQKQTGQSLLYVNKGSNNGNS